jgi:glycyl-tRNA synthetase beta chain
MPTLLLEIGCEELPSSAVYEAGDQLPRLVREQMGADVSEMFLGPRRLAVLVRDLQAETPEEWVKGPPVSVGEKAAEGFARKLGVPRDALVERNGVLGWTRPAQPVETVLPEQIDAIVASIGFGKSMIWEQGGARFARPVRWLLARLDDQAIVGGASQGRRGRDEIEVATAEAYADALRAHEVEPSLERRRETIVVGLDALGDWDDPMRKLREVVNLVEWPTVIEASFDERFLQLPRRVVETAMQSHQRYFPLGGTRFAIVANGGDPDVVRTGNERVLRGRLEDAEFTFQRDVTAGIEELATRLHAITFLRGGGSYADKTARLRDLVVALGGDDVAGEAARLCKADQAAELVREFPELEGHVGAEYARLAGSSEDVCQAIDEHYLPDQADAPLPATEAGRVLAAADKLDTLSVAYGLGLKPTGSRDPFALRRAAIGLCRLAIEGDVVVPLDDEDVRGFVEDRLEGVLAVSVEIVRAARGAPHADLRSIATLATFLGGLDPDRLRPVQEVHTRAARIVGGTVDDELVNKLLLREDAELALADALDAFDPTGDLEADFAAAARLAPIVEQFFENVLVMDPDEAIRANRLRLLRDVRDRVGRLGDFAQLPG